MHRIGTTKAFDLGTVAARLLDEQVPELPPGPLILHNRWHPALTPADKVFAGRHRHAWVCREEELIVGVLQP